MAGIISRRISWNHASQNL